MAALAGWATIAEADPGSPRVVHRATVEIDSPPPTTFRLENGLSVVLLRQAKAGEVDVSMRYRVGYLDDPPGYSGLAHLVEHMTFRGSRHLRPFEAFSALERVGATSINGMTRPLDTTYYSTVPAEQLETALWIESERMAFTLEKLSEANLILERRIVEDEQRQRDGFDFETHVLQLIFPPGHPYHPQWPSWADLEAVRLRDVQWFFQRWYRPDNATLVLTGDLDQERVVDLIQKYFGPIAAPRKPVPVRSPRAIAFTTVRRAIVAAPVAPERMTFVWTAQSPGASDLVMLSFASFILDERLRRQLVSDGHVAQAVGVERVSLGDTSMFWVNVVLQKSSEYQRVENAVASVLQKLRSEPVQRRELEEARSRFATVVASTNPAEVTTRTVIGAGELLRIGLHADASALMNVARRYFPLDRCLVAALSTSPYAPRRGEIERQWETR